MAAIAATAPLIQAQLAAFLVIRNFHPSLFAAIAARQSHTLGTRTTPIIVIAGAVSSPVQRQPV